MKPIRLKRSGGAPLYLQLAAQVRDRINCGDYLPNSLLPSESEFSNSLKINHLTLRKALRQLEEEGYIYKIRGKGTYVSEQRVTPEIKEMISATKMIAIPMPETSEDSYSAVTSQGATDYFHEHSLYRVMRLNYYSQADERTRIERKRNMLCGLIWNPFLASKEFFYNLKFFQQELKLPVVIAGNLAMNIKPDADHAYSDDIAGARQTVKQFVRRGHRNISYFATVLRPRMRTLRRLGYELAIKEMGLTPNIIKLNSISGNLSQTVNAYHTFLDLYQSGKRSLPDAILAENDVSASGIFKALREMKVNVPDDIELIGFGDIWNHSHYYAATEPKLSTVRVDYYKIGEIAAKLMLKRLKNPDLPYETITVPTRFIKRNTTK